MNRVILTGDTHGNMSQLYKVVQKSKVDEGDWIVILGDFGFVWNGTWKDNLYTIGRMTKANLLVVLGNHENYNIIETKMASEWCDKVNNYAWHPSANVYIVFDGGYYEIGGKRLFCVNGADSTDKHLRCEGRDWWPEERLNYEQMDSIAREMERHPEVDVICSHCTASTVKAIMWPQYVSDPSPMERFMEFVYNNMNFKEAYFGHYHDERDMGKYHCLYQSWVELE